MLIIQIALGILLGFILIALVVVFFDRILILVKWLSISLVIASCILGGYLLIINPASLGYLASLIRDYIGHVVAVAVIAGVCFSTYKYFTEQR